MERSLRRAKAPLAFSEGFNPHPKIAFASALAVGTTGYREYLDVELAGRVHIADFSRSLKEAFPPAIEFVAAEEIGEHSKSLTAAVNLAVFRLEATVQREDEAKAAVGVAGVLAAKELWRKAKEKPGKKPAPAKEVRGLIRRIEIVGVTEAGPAADCRSDGAQAAEQWLRLALEMELYLRADGQLRPQELWEMICIAGDFGSGQPTSVSRMALLICTGGKVSSPMEGVAI
jgi:radical SAM-linked protein